MSLLLAAVIGLGGLALIRQARARAVAQWQERVTVAAEDRVMAVQRWVADEVADAKTIAAFPTAVYLASGRTRGPFPFPVEEGPRAHLHTLLEEAVASMGYRWIVVVGQSGGIEVVAGDVQGSEARARAVAEVVLGLGEARAEFARHDGSRPVVLFAAPVMLPNSENGTAGQPVGVVVLGADPEDWLFPFLSFAPGGRSSQRTLLIRTGGGGPEVLWPGPDAVPDAGRLGAYGVGDLAAAVGQAAAGRMDGVWTDGGGAPVVGAARQVRGTPWVVAVTVDLREALSAFWTRTATWTAVIGGVLVAGAGLGFGWWWRRRAHQQQAELAFDASEARYRALFESANDAVLLIEEGRIVDCNQEAERVFGRSRPELVGSHPGDLSPDRQPDGRPSREKADSVMAAALADRPQRFEWLHLTSAGTEVLTEIHLGRVVLPDRTLLQAVLRDITERRRLDEVRNRLAAAVEQVDEGIVIADSRWNVVYLNPSYERMAGVSADDMVGQPLDLTDEDGWDQEQVKALSAALAAGEPWRGRIVSRRGEDAEVAEDVTVSPVRDASGAISHYVAIRNDVTEQQQLERQLVQAQKIEAVGRLAGGVAHDFNNLLSVILSYSGFIREELAEDHPARSDLDDVITAAERAARLTSQLLAFSRRQVTQPEQLDVNDVVIELEKMLRRLIGEDVELGTELDPDPATVVADRSHLEQVLMNLAVNARDAMPEGGRLVIRTFRATVEEEEARLRPGLDPGPYVVLEVKDTGQGMDAGTLARIFEPFFTTKETGKGTGLGLAMVYGLVKQNHGYIAAESEPGQGSTFRILLPPRARDDSSSSGHQPVPPEGRIRSDEVTVLVVEDDDAVRTAVCRMLERAGYRVLASASPEDALLTCERHSTPIDVLLTDVVMPEMNGIELSARATRHRPDLQTLFMTGYSDDRVRGQLPPDRVVRKPFRPDDLVEHIRRLLEWGPDVDRRNAGDGEGTDEVGGEDT